MLASCRGVPEFAVTSEDGPTIQLTSTTKESLLFLPTLLHQLAIQGDLVSLSCLLFALQHVHSSSVYYSL